MAPQSQRSRAGGSGTLQGLRVLDLPSLTSRPPPTPPHWWSGSRQDNAPSCSPETTPREFGCSGGRFNSLRGFWRNGWFSCAALLRGPHPCETCLPGPPKRSGAFTRVQAEEGAAGGLQGSVVWGHLVRESSPFRWPLGRPLLPLLQTSCCKWGLFMDAEIRVWGAPLRSGSGSPRRSFPRLPGFVDLETSHGRAQPCPAPGGPLHTAGVSGLPREELRRARVSSVLRGADPSRVRVPWGAALPGRPGPPPRPRRPLPWHRDGTAWARQSCWSLPGRCVNGARGAREDAGTAAVLGAAGPLAEPTTPRQLHPHTLCVTLR